MNKPMRKKWFPITVVYMTTSVLTNVT